MSIPQKVRREGHVFDPQRTRTHTVESLEFATWEFGFKQVIASLSAWVQNQKTIQFTYAQNLLLLLPYKTQTPTIPLSIQTLKLSNTMAITRVLRTSSSPIHLAGSSSTNSSSLMTSVRCRIKANLNADDILPQKVERKPMVALKASVAESEHIITSQSVIPRGFLELVPNIGRVIQSLLTTTTIVKSIKQWNLHPQMLIEKVYLSLYYLHPLISTHQ